MLDGCADIFVDLLIFAAKTYQQFHQKRKEKKKKKKNWVGKKQCIKTKK